MERKRLIAARKRHIWTLAEAAEKLEVSINALHRWEQGKARPRQYHIKRIARFPVQAMGLSAAATFIADHPAEDILTHCAAGIVACRHRGRGQHEDMTLAYQAVSTYLPALKTIVKDEDRHRKEAARLTAQCLMLKALFTAHNGNLSQAATLAQQAVTYSKESDNLSIHLATLQHLAWIFECDKQEEKALEQSLQTQNIIKHTKADISPILKSRIYSTLARGQASQDQRAEAIASLKLAHQFFSASSEKEHLETDYNISNLVKRDGET